MFQTEAHSKSCLVNPFDTLMGIVSSAIGLVSHMNVFYRSANHAVIWSFSSKIEFEIAMLRCIYDVNGQQCEAKQREDTRSYSFRICNPASFAKPWRT